MFRGKYNKDKMAVCAGSPAPGYYNAVGVNELDVQNL